MKSEKDKEALLEQFKKTPIVQVACEKVGVARATFYRWKKDDKEFSEKADSAILNGSFLINDMAESQLISLVKERNFQAIMYWLRHHHPSYTNRLEVTAQLKQVQDELTPEQEAVVREALRLASLGDEVKKNIINPIQNI